MAKKLTPQFDKPDKVVALTETMQTVENLRADDRALIDSMANGMRPYTPEEAEKYQIHVNVNWLEMTNDIMDANGQVNNALIFKDRFFKATSEGGKVEKRDKFSEDFTRNIHKALKRGKGGKQLMNVLKSRNAAVTLHGKGVLMWMNGYDWLPRYIPLEDLLIPTDTLVDFSNLNLFAVNLYLTLTEFFDMTHGEKVAKGWNVPASRRILDDLATPTANSEGSTFTFRDQPEKRVEQFKQNRALYDADAAKTVKLRMVFYKDPEDDKWYRVAVLREGTPNQPANKDWIYDGRETAFADDLDHILFVLYGDNNLCPPLKFHSVRGLGVMLYGPTECNNRLRCEIVQHTLQALKTLLRVSNPVDRDRPKILDLSQYSVVPDGISIVPAAERHEVDPRLIEFSMNQMRQIMSENSANYVQDINSSAVSKQPITAAETNARVQGVNVKVSAMLQSAYSQEAYFFEEIVRRFLLSNTGNKQIEKFQKACKKGGIPNDLMKPENWIIDPERVLGGGDNFLATQEANSLLSQSERFDPPAQRVVLRKWVTTTTRNPAMGELLVPENKQDVSDGAIAAENVFGTLMHGIPASIRQGIERSDYIEALLGMLKAKIQQYEGAGEIPDFDDLAGMKAVLTHIAQNLQILGSDQTQKQLVKELGDMFGQLANLVKKFDQQFAEQKRAQQPDPETNAKVQGMVLQSQTKAQLSQQSAQQKLQQSQAKFQLQMQQAMEKHRLEMEAMMAATQAELTAEAAAAGADIHTDRVKAGAQIENDRMKAEAQAENQKLTAKASAKNGSPK